MHTRTYSTPPQFVLIYLGEITEIYYVLSTVLGHVGIQKQPKQTESLSSQDLSPNEKGRQKQTDMDILYQVDNRYGKEKAGKEKGNGG